MEVFTFTIIILLIVRKILIDDFKIAYYEKKLHNRDVDISKVQNTGLFKIFFGKD